MSFKNFLKKRNVKKHNLQWIIRSIYAMNRIIKLNKTKKKQIRAHAYRPFNNTLIQHALSNTQP